MKIPRDLSGKIHFFIDTYQKFIDEMLSLNLLDMTTCFRGSVRLNASSLSAGSSLYLRNIGNEFLEYRTRR